MPPPAPSVALVAAVDAGVDAGPFREGPDLVFTFVKGAPTLQKVRAAGSSGATVAPDGRTYFVDLLDAKRSGGLLVSDAHPDGIFFSTKEVHDVRFSSDGKHMLVLDDEMAVVTMVSVPDGQIEAQGRGARVARFLGPATVAYWNGCRVMHLEIGAAAPVPVGPESCGGADASDDGKTWVVGSPSRAGVLLSMRPYRKVVRIDGVSGVPTTLLEATSDDDAATELRLSPRGDRLCYGGRGMRCMTLDASGAHPLPSPPGEPYTLVWDDAGEQQLFLQANELTWADFRSRTYRRLELGKISVRYWRFFPSGRRIVVYDKGAWSCELESAVCTQLFAPTTEVGGFSSTPGTDHRFLMGNEVGSAREYYWVELP